MPETIKINEIFTSLQGEGSLAGVTSIFIRLAGCPLRCKWCDTKYAWSPESGKNYTFDQVKKYIMSKPCGHIVVTGGEPMVSKNFSEFINFMSNSPMHITIETSGIEYIENLKCDLMSISPKLSNSWPEEPELKQQHKRFCLNLKAIRSLMQSYSYQLKFVVDTQSDLNEIAEVVDKLSPNPDKVMLMPQAVTPQDYITKSKWIADVCIKTGFRFSPRLQVLLWPNQKEK